jgi:hypothetical protein
MIEMGIVVGIGIIVMLARLSWRSKMMLLSNPLVVDIAVFVLLSVMHWGTFSGLMVAAVGALFCSITLSIARWLFGYVANGAYKPGVFNVGDKL